MVNHERNGGAASATGGSERTPRTHSAGIVRALVVAAAAAAASAAGCYDSDPGDDVADVAADDSADVRPEVVDTYAAPMYGVP